MLYGRKKLVVTVAATFLVACFMGMAETEPIAEVMMGSSGINWMPKVSYDRLILTVSAPDGTVMSKTFKGGSAPYFDLSFFDGKSVVDGSYTYELRLIPHMTRKVRQAGSDTLKAGLKDDEGFVQRAWTQNGHFQVQGGSIITPTTQETPDRPLDVLHYDDVIITGSLCVGFDCADGESFGYCTIKLKENNLQICFEDTSIGTFPTNDWKIQINDTTSGGASYFTIWDTDGGRRPFTIEAGAPAHSLYVEDYGRVGLGTSVPYVELHIVDGDTPTVRLDQDGSSGWSPQSWDLAGNETNFFIRDVTNGSKLSFRIQPNTPSNTLCLKSDGKVGIGTWSPSDMLEIETTGANSTLKFDRTDGATVQFAAKGTKGALNVETNHQLEFGTNNTTRMTIAAGGNVGIGISPTHLLHLNGGAYCDGGAWVPGSSREYKENIQALSTDEAMEAFKDLNPVKFNYKVNKEEDYLGFISEDVPELVATKERKGVSPMDVVAVLTKVVQEQQKTIAELKEKVEKLEKR